MKGDFQKKPVVKKEDLVDVEESGGIINWIHNKLVRGGVDKGIVKKELELNKKFVKDIEDDEPEKTENSTSNSISSNANKEDSPNAKEYLTEPAGRVVNSSEEAVEEAPVREVAKISSPLKVIPKKNKIAEGKEVVKKAAAVPTNVKNPINVSKKEVVKKVKKPVVAGRKPKIDVAKIAQEIMKEQIKQQREPVKETLEGVPDKIGKVSKRYIKTGIEGFDVLLDKGIPKKSTLLVAGGAGSGKTIFCLQIVANKVNAGKKCLYMSFEENEEKLIQHMEDLGFEPKKLIDTGNLRIQRTNPFDITRNVDALLAKQKGELLIEVDPVIIPRDFKPDFIFLDSLTAIASAFTGKEESYRIYIEQLFRFFEKIGATSFLITETEQIPKIFSKTGVEEFLADGVIVMYNLKQRNVRENAIEILKLRGAGHQKKIVAFQITPKGIVIYPEQEVFSEME